MATWLEYLEQAKAEPVGIAILCHSPEDADTSKRNLYATRAKAREEGNKTFDSLSISMSPHSDEILYVYESEVKDAQEPGEGSEASDDTAV